MKRVILTFCLAFLLSISPWVNANPGGNGDANRDFQCGGSCHGDPDLNASSPATFQPVIPERIYEGLPAEISVVISSLPQTETGIFGAFLLTSLNANNDIPSTEGWSIISNSNLGQTNYQEQVLTTGDSLIFNWTLSNSEIITSEFYVALNHGSSDNDLSHLGVSQAFEISTVALPSDMPSVVPGFEPLSTRVLGEDTTISIPTQNAENVIVELKGQGGQNSVIEVRSNGSQVWEITIPQAIRESSLQWRVIVEGDGLTTTSAWYSMTSSEPTFESNNFPIILQGIGVALMGAAFVTLLHRRLRNTKTLTKKYEQTEIVNASNNMKGDQIQSSYHNGAQNDSRTIPPLPETGLPAGWNMEQWEYYGQDYLDGKMG